MMSDSGCDTRSQFAVIATKPPSTPLSAIVTSGFPNRPHAVMSAATAPAAAAKVVVRAI